MTFSTSTPLRSRARLLLEPLEYRTTPSAVYVQTAPPVQVNVTHSAFSQEQVQLAVDGQDRPTVVWADNGLDSDGFGIYARRLNADLTPAGNQFRVNSVVKGDEEFPGVGKNAAGQTVVAFRDGEQSPSGIGGNGAVYSAPVAAQIYTASGQPVGGNFQATTYGTDPSDPSAREPYDESAVYVSPGGDFTIATLQQYDAPVPTTDPSSGLSYFYYQCRMSRFAADGTPVADTAVTFYTSPPSDGTADHPYVTVSQDANSVRFGADGSVYVPWTVTSERQVPDVGTQFDYKVHVTRISPTGDASTDALVASATFNSDNVPNDSRLLHAGVAPLADGGFLTLYLDATNALVAQRFTAAGSAAGSRTTLAPAAAFSSGGYFSPGATPLSDGNVVATWDQFIPFDDGPDSGLKFQVLTAGGIPVSPVTPLNDLNYKSFPATAADNAGGFYLAWSDPSGSATGDSVVKAEHFAKADLVPVLTGGTVSEFRPAGSFVGSLSTSVDTGHTYIYSLVSGVGSTGNASFKVSGNDLVTTGAFDAVAQSSYSVRVRATDETGAFTEQVFTVTVADDPAVALGNRVLYVTGTAAADTFDFAAGAVEDELALNGVNLAVPAANVDAVEFDGGAGANSADLTGRGANNVAGLNPTYGFLSGSGFAVWAVNSGTITARAGGTGAVAYLVGTAGADALVATPTYAALSGAGYADAAAGFGTTVAYSQGGADTATLAGSAGNDVFLGTPTYSVLTGAGFANYAIGFQVVTAATGGGKDAAYLTDSTGVDVLTASGSLAKLTTAAGTAVQVDGFSVIAYGSAGGKNKKTISGIGFYLATPGDWTG